MPEIAGGINVPVPGYQGGAMTTTADQGASFNGFQEKLALKDFQRAAGGDSLNGTFEALSAGLDKLEDAGYDVSDIKALADQAHKTENRGALREIANSMAGEIESGEIANRLPENQGGEGGSQSADLPKSLALQDFDRAAGGDSLNGTFEALSAGLDKLEDAGYDVSDIKELADQAHQDEDKTLLRNIASTMGDEIRDGTIDNRLPQSQMSDGGHHQSAVPIPGFGPRFLVV